MNDNEITIDQAAERLGLTHDAVQKLITRGTLKARLIGPARRGIWLIDPATVEAEALRRQEYQATKRGRPPKKPTS